MRNQLIAWRLVVSLLFSSVAMAQTWQPVGPPGGDIRVLAADPADARVLYLGTSDGHLFTSRDGGEHWQLLSRVGERDDTVVMTLLVSRRDSKVLYAGTWTLGSNGGGVYRSSDSGRTWKPAGLEGRTVRMLVESEADPNHLAAATLEGVFESHNAGRDWTLLTPAKHDDLRNFDSVAIDPRDASTLYAGTYHLAWKTHDGGRNWQPIHTGMIDDSDVMDLQIDRRNPEHVFATACSGMYRSENRGEQWRKLQGIPATARRTHFITQDPVQPNVFYAGTTQGLWKSGDDATTWKRITSANWSIIGLVLDAKRPGRLVLGVERRGIEISDDGGSTFRSSNAGFHHQQIVAFATDPVRPERMLVVLTNSAIPMMVSPDGGKNWAPLGPGLAVEGVRGVFGAPNGWWAALEKGGLMRYDEKKAMWVKAGRVKMSVAAPKPAAKGKAAAKARPATLENFRAIYEVVYDMAFARDLWLAATPRGLLASRDRGDTWTEFALPGAGPSPAFSLKTSADAQQLWVLAAQGLLVSADSGKTWSRRSAPIEPNKEVRLHRADDGTLAVTSRRGLFLSLDGGHEWRQAELPELAVSDFAATEDGYLVSTEKGRIYISWNQGRRWNRMETSGVEAQFLNLRRIGATGVVIAASSTEGLQRLEVRPQPATVAAASR